MNATCPMPRPDVLDAYFQQHRAKLVDIAAFLDRVDRSGGGGDDDLRIRALIKAIPLLIDGRADRARRILELLSDHTTEPVEKAPAKGAIGVDPHGAY